MLCIYKKWQLIILAVVCCAHYPTSRQFWQGATLYLNLNKRLTHISWMLLAQAERHLKKSSWNSPGRGGYWGCWWWSGCCWWCSTSGGGLQGADDDTGGRGELLMSSILMAAIATWNTDWLNAIETLRLSERAKPKQGQKWRAGSSQRLHFFGTSLSLSLSPLSFGCERILCVCVRNLYLRFSTFAAYFWCCARITGAHKNCQCVYSCMYTKLV